MKRILIFTLVFVLTVYILIAKVFVFKEIYDPKSIVVDEKKIYITENCSIFIYSKKDMELLKRFGSKGQGPGEFLIAPGLPIKLYIDCSRLIINSLSKVSIYNKNGEFIKDIKIPTPDSEFQPLNKMYVGSLTQVENDKLYYIINLYDRNLNHIRRIFRHENPFQPNLINQGFNPIVQSESTLKFISKHNKIIVNDINGIIHIFNLEGEKILKFGHKFDRVNVTKNLKKEIYDYYKQHPGTKIMFNYIKNFMKFPKHFPMIRDYFVANEKIYILPYTKKKDENTIFVFDFQGNLLDKISLHIAEKNILELYPYYIHNNEFYQLIMNNGEWELNIQPIKIRIDDPKN